MMMSMISILYTGLLTFFFISFIYNDEMSLPLLLESSLPLFVPIAFSQKLKLGYFAVNALSISGGVLGYIAASIFKSINIWPIALCFWLLWSVPTIVLLNVVAKVTTKYSA